MTDEQKIDLEKLVRAAGLKAVVEELYEIAAERCGEEYMDARSGKKPLAAWQEWDHAAFKLRQITQDMP